MNNALENVGFRKFGHHAILYGENQRESMNYNIMQPCTKYSRALITLRISIEADLGEVDALAAVRTKCNNTTSIQLAGIR